MINFNGNLGILPHSSSQHEYQYTIDKEIVMDLLDKTEFLGIKMIAVEGRNLFLAQGTTTHDFDFFPPILNSDQILSRQNLHDNPVSITIEVQEHLKAQLINYINNNFNDLVEVSEWNGPDSIIEVCTKGVNKATGLKFLADLYGVSQADIIAIGDQSNDYSMIQYAGLGVAMQNASSEIKQIANDITVKSNDEDGVADYLANYFGLKIAK